MTEKPASGGPGIILREAFYPERAPIDTYGDGGFKFDHMAHNGALLCLPSGIHRWPVTTVTDCTLEAFLPVFDEASDIEILLFGTGKDLVPIETELRFRFRENQIMADPMSTGAAVRTYNVLLAEGRAVAAALIAVD